MSKVPLFNSPVFHVQFQHDYLCKTWCPTGLKSEQYKAEYMVVKIILIKKSQQKLVHFALN